MDVASKQKDSFEGQKKFITKLGYRYFDAANPDPIQHYQSKYYIYYHHFLFQDTIAVIHRLKDEILLLFNLADQAKLNNLSFCDIYFLDVISQSFDQINVKTMISQCFSCVILNIGV